jgi:uncharacterized protein (DUF2147 family)
MLTRYSLTAALIFASAQSAAAQSLDGVWVQEDGSTTVRVAPCPGVQAPATPSWCATVIAEKPEPGQASNLNQTVVRDMRRKGKQGWTGIYAVDGLSMKASAKLLRPEMLSFKICAIAFLCETLRFVRQRG